MAEVRRAFVEIVGLRLPAADPANFFKCGERRGSGGGVGRLAVVDEQDAVFFAHALHAVREPREGAKGFGDSLLIDFESATNSNSSIRILRVVRSLQAGPLLLTSKWSWVADLAVAAPWTPHIGRV